MSAKYRKEYDINAELYEDYLDKLVQLPFPIPEIKESVADYVRSLLQREDVFGRIPTGKFKKEYEPLVSICGPACKDNPRAIIRFLNRLLILTRVHEQKKSEMEISLVHFGITNALQMNWQSIYKSCEQDRQILYKPGSAEEEKVNLCKLLGFLFGEFSTDTDLVDRLEELGSDEANPERSFFQILSTDESLRKLLSSAPGVEWLSKPNLRKEAAATTEQVKAVTETDSDSIRVKYVLRGADEYTDDGWPVVRGCVIMPIAKLKGANLEGANLGEANLRTANLRGANLERANLEGADLRTADLEGADLRMANLKMTNLRTARYSAATIWPKGYHPASGGAIKQQE